MKKVFKNKTLGIALFASAVLSLGLFSCNKDFQNTLEDNFNPDSTDLKLGTRKAILIVLDGAVGAEVRAIAPKNLTLMSDFSIYSYDALTDFRTAENLSAERGWANILTGVYAEKHGVTTGDLSQNNFSNYPSIFTRLKQKRDDWETAAFGTSSAFINELAKDASIKEAVANDAAVKEAVVNQLKTDENISFITAQFSGLDKAGKAGSYSAGDAGYKSAVQKTDEYIGEILSAMRSREQFDNENWLVIVTSSSGSEVAGDPEGAFRNSYSDSRRNSLFFVYNPRFNSQTATKPGTIIPYIGTAPMFNGKQNGSLAEVLNDDNLFDFGETGSYTIQCKVKIKPGNYYYPAILGKREKWAGGFPGWVIFLEADYWMINFGQVGQGNTQVKGQKVSDDKWHTLTAVIKQEGANRMVYTYTDGIASGNSANIASKGNINTTRPLMVGHFDEDGTAGPDNFLVTDIRIYNTALEAGYIAESFCKVDIAEEDEYAKNLLGYWPVTSVTGDKKLLDYSGNNKPMTINLLNAVDFNDVSSQVCPSISDEVYRTVPNSVDAANQLYLWFGILISKDWHLDGKSWVPAYTDLNN